MTVCTSNSGAACTNSTWNQGWIVFADLNNNGQVTAGGAPGERPARAGGLHRHPSGHDHPQQRGQLGAASTAKDSARAAGLVTTTFTLVDGSTGNAAYTRCLLLQPVGMVVIQTHAINPATC